VTSDFRLEVEIRQFRTFALKNDSVSHNGLRAMGQIPRSTERISSLVKSFVSESYIVRKCRLVGTSGWR